MIELASPFGRITRPGLEPVGLTRLFILFIPDDVLAGIILVPFAMVIGLICVPELGITLPLSIAGFDDFPGGLDAGKSRFAWLLFELTAATTLEFSGLLVVVCIIPLALSLRLKAFIHSSNFTSHPS